MSNKLSVAIVGCGAIAPVHANALSKLSEIEISGFCDTDLSKAQKLSSEFGGKAFDDFETMINELDLYCIHICTPHFLHLPMIKKCYENGIAVFCEKPPIIDRSQWEELMTIESDRIGFCFQNRYNPEVIYMKKLIESKKCGKFLGARAFVTWKRDEDYYLKSAWRGKKATEGGGALINQTIHTLDLIIHLMGKPDSVDSALFNRHLKGIIEVEDTVDAYLKYDNYSALFYATTAHSSDSKVFLEIECEDLSLRYEEDSLIITYSDGKTENISLEHALEVFEKSYWGKSHFMCIVDFYKALSLGEKAPICKENISDTIDIMLKIYESERGEVR